MGSKVIKVNREIFPGFLLAIFHIKYFLNLYNLYIVLLVISELIRINYKISFLDLF